MFVLFIALVSYEKRCMRTDQFVSNKKEDVEKYGKEWLCKIATDLFDKGTNQEEWTRVCSEQSLQDIQKYICDHTMDCPVIAHIEKVYITTSEEKITYVNGKHFSIEWN